MPSLIVPLLGRGLTTALLIGQDVSTAGILSDGTTYTIATTITNLGFTDEPETEEINALNTTNRNEVIISEGQSMTLEIYKVNGTTDGNILATARIAYDYFNVQWVEGTVTGSIQTWSFYGVRKNFTTGMQGRGKQIAELQLGPVDIGQDQTTRTVS